MNLLNELFPNFNNYSNYWDCKKKVWQIVIENKIDANIIEESADIHKSAIITNSIIGKNVKIYEGVTIRDSVILDNTVVGHCSEIARSILLQGCFVPRFNYIGGSFLGENVRLGGQTTLATKRHDDRSVKLYWGNELIDTGEWKFGSIVGHSTIIAYSVHVNPGTVVGANSIIYPYVDLWGFIPSNSIVSVQQKIKRIEKRNLPNIEMLIQGE